MPWRANAAPDRIVDDAPSAVRHLSGGAPQLGVSGIASAGLGRSIAKAARNAAAMTYRFAAGHLIQRVERDIVGAAVTEE